MISKLIENGIYKVETIPGGIDRDKYHDYKAISRSAMEWIIPSAGGTPEKYKYMQITAPIVDDETSKAMHIGSGVHLFAENPAEFRLVPYDKPGAGVRRVVEALPEVITPTSIDGYQKEVVALCRALEYNKLWKDETVFKKIVEEGMTYLSVIRDKTPHVFYASYDEAAVISQCISSMKNVKEIMSYLSVYGPEWELLTEVPLLFKINGREFKVLLDRLLLNHTDKVFIVQDIKTTSSSIPGYIGYDRPVVYNGSKTHEHQIGKMYDYGIHRQLEFYKSAVEIFYPGYTCISADVLIQQTVAPFEFRKETVSENWLHIGATEVVTAINEIHSIGELVNYDM
jgi:hypothetical protein